MKAFVVTSKDQYRQAINIKPGKWTFHLYANSSSYSFGLKSASGHWTNYDLSDQVKSGAWCDVSTTIDITYNAVEISIFNHTPTGDTFLLLPMLEYGEVKSEKRPNDLDIEESAIIRSSSWSLRTSSPVIYKDSTDADTDGSHTPVTVTGQLWEGGSTSEGGFITVTPDDEVEPGTAVASPVTISPPDNADKSLYTVRLYDTDSKDNLLDITTIPVVFKGASGVNAIRVTLSNEVDSLPADNNGDVTKYDNTGTDIRVFEGATELVYDGVGNDNGKYNVTGSGVNITPGAKSLSGIKCVFGNASNMTSDKASIVFLVTGKTLRGESFSILTNQNFSKSIAGENGLTVQLYVQGHFHAKNENGVITKEIVGGVLHEGEEKIKISTVIRKGSDDVTDEEISTAIWKINNTQIASGVKDIYLDISYADGEHDKITLTYDGNDIITEILDLQDGKDGKDHEYIYTRTTTDEVPDTPDSAQQDDFVPDGWTDDFSGVDETFIYEWVSERKKINGVWGAYSIPAKYAKYAFDAISGTLTNKSITLTADADGNVSDYVTANGTFIVRYGVVNVSSQCNFSVLSSYGCDVNINNSSNKGYYSVTNVCEDNAFARLRAVYKNAILDEDLTISLSKQGENSPLLFLSISSSVMTFDSNNNPKPQLQTITIEAKIQNITGTATFTAIPYIGSTAQSPVTLGGSGNTRTLTQAQWGANVDRIVITATLGSLTDTETIVKLKDGKEAPYVTSVYSQYYLSSSKTSLSGGSWLTSMPVWTEGKFIHTRTVTTLSDNSAIYGDRSLLAVHLEPKIIGDYWHVWDSELYAYVNTGDKPVGADPIIPYPRGYWAETPEEPYERNAITTVYVECAGNYYVLNKEGSFTGTNNPNPVTDYADNGANATWVLMTKFEQMFVKILMANWASIGGAIFTGDYADPAIRERMISRIGIKSGSSNSNYQEYSGDSGAWQPNIMLDFITGKSKFTNTDIKGNINATSGTFNNVDIQTGTIGGLSIEGNSLINEGFGDDAYIIFRNDPNGQFVGIGHVEPASSGGAKTMGRFEIARTSTSRNTALKVAASGSSSENIALAILAGSVSGLALKVRSIISSTTLNYEDTYVSCYNTSAVNLTLPSSPSMGKIVFMRKNNSYEITVYGNGKNIAYGNGNTSSSLTLSDVGRSELAMFVFDGSYWLYNKIAGGG